MKKHANLFANSDNFPSGKSLTHLPFWAMSLTSYGYIAEVG